MYRAITSFTTNEYEVRKKQLLADDFTNQDEIDEFLRIGYIEVYDGSLEITENGIYNVEDYQTAEVEVQSGNLTDEEYAEANTDVDTILENTQLTPVYPPDWSQIGYTDTPKSIIEGFNLAKTFKNNWNPSNTSLQYIFNSNKEIMVFPLVDTKNVTNMGDSFSYSSIVTFPKINTSKVTNMATAFSGCQCLKDFPALEIPLVTSTGSLYNMFNTCPCLTNESLNNIMAMCISATNISGTKTLRNLGLTSAQCTICQGLSNYAALQNAGWTTGY